MDSATTKKAHLRLVAGAILGLVASLQIPLGIAEERLQTRSEKLLHLEERAKTNYDAYILGPGDGLEVELVDLLNSAENFRLVQMELSTYHAFALNTWKG